MASTTKTTNVQLSQFAATDKVSWLVDYNGDMKKIDTKITAMEKAVSPQSLECTYGQSGIKHYGHPLQVEKVGNVCSFSGGVTVTTQYNAWTDNLIKLPASVQPTNVTAAFFVSPTKSNEPILAQIRANGVVTSAAPLPVDDYYLIGSFVSKI